MIWKPVYGLEVYEASNTGLIRRTKTQRILSPYIDKDGYQRVMVRWKAMQVKRTYGCHQLVARAFLGEPPVGFVVNHKNANKLDNTPSNLEYVTPGDNARHGFLLGLMHPHSGEGHYRSKLTAQQVREIRLMLEAGKSQVELAEQYGVVRQAIGDIKTGRNWRHTL